MALVGNGELWFIPKKIVPHISSGTEGKAIVKI